MSAPPRLPNLKGLRLPINAFHVIALALDPGFILRARRIQPDAWQQRLLLCEDRQILLNCSRQSGKSTTVAALALHTALYRSRSLVLLLSPSLRQSIELFRKVLDCFDGIREMIAVNTLNQTSVEFANRSRIICLPGKEETIRSFSGVNMLVIDEAARVPEDLYRSVRPMLAVSRGRLICLSTPFGKRGFFYREWEGCEQSGTRGGADIPVCQADQNVCPTTDWLRIRIPWQECPRIGADFIELEKRSMGESWIRQEYECSFEALEGLVFPDFEQQTVISNQRSVISNQAGGDLSLITDHCSLPTQGRQPLRAGVGDHWSLPEGRRVGGIDFGFRNPFCALWGVLDRDDVLWISDERYVREAPLHEHVAALREAEDRGSRMGGGADIPVCQADKNVCPTRSSIIWYADPAGRTEIEELRHAGLKVIRGNNDIQAGIAAINARLRTGRLRIRREGCPNLLAESKLYRYPGGNYSGATSSEIPIDQHNHALAALRYLVSRLDAGFMAKFRNSKNQEPNSKNQIGAADLEFGSSEFGSSQRPRLRLDNEQSWKTVIGERIKDEG
jgi:hypothetical protein